MQPSKIHIASYDPNWSHLFNCEAERIRTILEKHVKEIHHIGSTAISNMPAKPVIDMLLVCDDIDSICLIQDGLKSMGYATLSRSVIPPRSFFTSRHNDPLIHYHLHLYEQGDPQINRHIHFKDYLTHHPEEALIYADIKKQLAKKYEYDRTSYVLGKSKLVQEIDAKAKCWPGRRHDLLSFYSGRSAEHWCEDKLMMAMEANLNVHMTYYAQYLPKIDLIRRPGFTSVNTRLPDDTFNYVLDADFISEAASQMTHDATAAFFQQHITFSWLVSPHDKPRDLSVYLENSGYINTENNTAMSLNLRNWDESSSSKTALKIVRATDEKTLLDFAMVLTNNKDAFKTYFSWIASVLTEDDPIEYYVGYLDGVPVVRGLTCYYAQVAGLHWLSTAMSYRHQGYGRAMQEYRLKRAKSLGYSIAVVHVASAEGYPLYKKLGYQECGVFKEFKRD